MFRLGILFLISLYTLTLKIIGIIYKHVYRSKSSLAEEKGSNFSENLSRLDDSEDNDSSAKTESSVLLQGGLVCNSSKYEVVCSKDLSGFLKEPKMVEFVVQELFVGSDNVVVRSDRVLDCETSDENGLFEQDLKENQEEFEQNLKEKDDEFDKEPETAPFYFKLLDTSYSTIVESQEKIQEMEGFVEKRKEDGSLKCLKGGEADGKEENSDFRDEEMNPMEDEFFSYQVELIPSSCNSDQESDANEDGGIISISPQEIETNDSDDWMSRFLDETKSNEKVEEEEEEDEDLDDEYVELEAQEIAPSSFSFVDARESLGWRDSDGDGDGDEDELDVLSEHQKLVQQMKMELKNCRIRGLPTISEESETPKMIEDLRPLEMDHKIGYKDVVEGIHNFYKSYSEKMKKLDILCYQTSHAISFLQLKESQVYPPCKKRADSALFFWPTRVRKIYADPMNKPINEMRKDLELVYVGQMCLSWEILSWLGVKAQELLEYESQGSHSYNQAADEFKKFQVLAQRFIEDEQFGGRRDDSYVKSRCMIRSLMQVPTIKDDYVAMNKERSEESDVITLEMLVEIIRESMVIFHEFVLADKKATNVGLTKIDFQEFGSEELMLEVISSLHKKGRRMREKIRSQNCIVKKLKKHQERRWSESETLAAQVELRLVWRVLNMSRLSEERLVWCKRKLNNIGFVGRKVRREASFLLFPC